MGFITQANDQLVVNKRQVVLPGDSAKQRGDQSGAAVIALSGSGDWGEASIKGHLFCGVATSSTIAAGNVNGAAAAASTNTGVLNPAGSGVLVMIQKVTAAVQSGTFTAGGIYHSVSRGTTIATSIVGFSRGLATNGYQSQTAQAFVLQSNAGVTLTGSSVLTTIGVMVGTTAAAVTTGLLSPVQDVVGGAIVLAPGDMYLPTFSGTGTTIIANFGYVWTEVPLTSN